MEEQIIIKGTAQAKAGLICGIISMVFSFLVPLIAIPTGVAGIICSSLGLKSGMARAKVGLGLSIAGVVIGILTYLVFFSLFLAEI